MLKSGAVLARSTAAGTRCLQVAISGPAATLSNYRVDGCERAADPALYEYANHIPCRCEWREYENSTSELASARGHELAPQLDENGDEFMLVEAFDEDKMERNVVSQDGARGAL